MGGSAVKAPAPKPDNLSLIPGTNTFDLHLHATVHTQKRIRLPCVYAIHKKC